MITITTTGVGAYLDGAAFIKQLIMGEPGAGKTRSASFWPAPIYANCERKSMSLLDRNVQSVQIGSLAQMDELMLLLRSEGQKPQAQRRWQTFVIDTFDAYQRTLINERLTKEHREKFINDDWNWLSTKISRFLEQVANLPMHVIINLHVKDVTEGEGDDKVIKTKPHLKGDVKDQIAAEFDLVGFMESYWSVEGVPGKAGERQKVLRRRIQWAQDERHPVLKDCSGQLGDYTDVDFTEGDFLRVWEPIIGRLDDLPESTEEEVTVPGAPQPTPAVAPVAPMDGGPVATPEQAVAAAAPPAKPPLKTPTPAKKAAAAKKAAPTKAAASPAAPAAPSPAPSTPVSSSGSTTEASSEIAGPGSEPASNPAGGEQASAPTAVPSPLAGPTGTATPVAVPDPSDDTAADAASADDVAQAQAALTDGGVQAQVVSEQPTADPIPEPTPEPDASAAVCCGDGEGPLQGCGKELPSVGKERDSAELAYIKWRHRLCASCYQLAKNNQLPRKAA